MSHWIVDDLETDLDGFHLGPVALTLDPTSAVAVLGTSGAGKTTFLRTLAGFLPVRGGRLLRDGTDVSDELPEERLLGYVPQGLGLFPHRTVERNIRYPMDLRNREDSASRTRDLLERFHLTSLRGRYPARLSGGEQQRVALARALAADPELIVWDEPWQALDVMARYELGLVLHEVREKERVPIVVVTHDASLAFSLADTFIVLHRGRVQVKCDAQTLLRSPSDPFMARFVGFENVYDRATLESALPSPFAAWLLHATGEGGVAFASPVLSTEPEGPESWEGIVRSVRPTPRGLTLEVRADGLLVSLSMPMPVPHPLPTIGQRRRFRVDPEAVHALAGPPPPGPEAS